MTHQEERRGRFEKDPAGRAFKDVKIVLQSRTTEEKADAAVEEHVVLILSFLDQEVEKAVGEERERIRKIVEEKSKLILDVSHADIGRGIAIYKEGRDNAFKTILTLLSPEDKKSDK